MWKACLCCVALQSSQCFLLGLLISRHPSGKTVLWEIWGRTHTHEGLLAPATVMGVSLASQRVSWAGSHSSRTSATGFAIPTGSPEPLPGRCLL